MVATHDDDRILFPKDGLRKSDLQDYYRAIAPIILPHLKDRPLSLQRFPRGINETGFYQKEAPEYFPDYVKRVTVPVLSQHTSQQQVMCQNVETLCYFVDQAVITMHPWLCTKAHLDKPDKLVFDLDPSGTDFDTVKQAALVFKDVCENRGLVPYVMATGSKGLHVIVPIVPEHMFDDVHQFARTICETIADENPQKYTTEVSKEKRNGRLFLDYMRNSYGQTSIAPYAVRPLDGAPVATPLGWDELPDLKNAHPYSLRTILKRIQDGIDPLTTFASKRKSLKI